MQNKSVLWILLVIGRVWKVLTIDGGGVGWYSVCKFVCALRAVCMGEEEGDFEREEGDAFARILLWAAD